MTDDITMNLENLQIDDLETNERKLFVGGLSWATTEDGLRQYFENLGLNVDTVTIMRDKRGRSRGFGFLTLASPKEIEMAISFHLHIDGRKVEAKRAIPQSDMSNHAKKIFVGGLPVSLTNIDFRKYFESFGKVLESQIMTDRESGRSRGFGFITFEEELTASEVLLITHTISGKPVEVKQAEPKSPQQVQPYPLTPLYIPNFAYSSVFSPITTDQASNYFTQAQSNLIYLPSVYDPSMVNGMDNNIRVNQETLKRTQAAPAVPKPSSPSYPIRVPIVYEEPENTNTLSPSSQEKSTTFKGLELRTERAFSEPWTERPDSENVSSTRLGRLSPPIKRRQGVISIQTNSQPPLGLRRNENWGRNTIPASQPLHKYFQ